MVTALKLCEGAAEELYVKTAETPLEASDFQVIFDRMNDMLLEWADSGLTPAFKEVYNGSDTVQIDDNARAAVKYALAIRCAPTFKRQITAGLVENATNSLQRLEASSSFIGPVAYPDTLPLGSGNDCASSYDRSRFFEQNKKGNF